MTAVLGPQYKRCTICTKVLISCEWLRNIYYSFVYFVKCLNIFNVELRRLHTDLFWCYKIVFCLVYVNLDDLFVFSPCQYTRGHKFKLYKRQTNSCV